MAGSAGSCLSSMACPHGLQKHSFATNFESRQSALPRSHSQVKQCFRQASVTVASCEEPLSCTDDGGFSGEKKSALNRRALVALGGIFTLSSIFTRSRAEEIPVNESEQIRQEMIQKIQARLNSPPAKAVESLESTPAADAAKKLLETIADIQQPDVQLEQESFLSNDLSKSELQTMPQQDEAGGISFGYLNNVGYLGSGVFGGLYWLERRAKMSTVSALQDMTSKLKAKEDTMISLKESLEGKLLDQKDQASRQLIKAKEGQETLSNELASVTTYANTIQKELDDKRSLVQDLEKQIESAQADIQEAGKQKTLLEGKFSTEQQKGMRLEEEIKILNSEIDTKGLEIKSLQSILKNKEKAAEDVSLQLNTKIEEILHAQHTIEDLEKEISVLNEKLSLSYNVVQDLRAKLDAAIAHGEETEKKMATVYQDLDGLKQSSAQELQAVQGSLISKVAEVEELTHRLKDTLNKSEEDKKFIDELQEKIRILKRKANEDNLAIERLTKELDASSQDLRTTKAQVDSLSRDLTDVRELNKQLDSRILDVQQEAEVNLTSLRQSLDHEQALSGKLSEQLKKVKDDLDFSRGEASSLNNQLKKFEISYEQLKKDFAESEAAVKAMDAALTKEKEITATNKRQLESARRAIAEAKENVKFLRQDIEKAKSESENMGKEVKELSKNLEAANAKVASLEIEKAQLSDSLHEEKRISRSLKEKMIKVDVSLEKLSKEKETTAQRAKILEGDLASTKGEMLRLKKQVTIMDTALNEAKSRVRGISEITQLQEQSENAAQISSEISSVQAELSNMQKSLKDAGTKQAEAEAAAGTLRKVMEKHGLDEDAVLVSPTSRHEEGTEA